MRLSELLSDTELKYDKSYADIEISGIVYDSRKVTDGSLFVCLEGESVNGHDFALSAQQNGAAAIIAAHPTDSTLPHILTDDT